VTRVLLVLALAIAVPAQGEVVPRPGPIDGRVQTIDYNAEDVVAVRAPLGYQVTIQFAQDERIENVAVGDAAAWQVTPNRRGDHLFVKPLQQGVRTNLTVVTDATSPSPCASAIPPPRRCWKPPIRRMRAPIA
jgi:type IV secretion system protein VirB9